MNPNKPTPRLIIIKMAKIKEISKGSKRKIKSQNLLKKKKYQWYFSQN